MLFSATRRLLLAAAGQDLFRLGPASLPRVRRLAHAAHRQTAHAPLTPAHVEGLAARLDAPGTSLLTSVESVSAPVAQVAPDELAAFNSDWMHKYHGQSRVVVQPRSTCEVSRVLSYCHQHRLAVVPQGGITGLVGGSVPVADEIILNMSRMNRIRSFDPVAGTLVADAGCVLQALDEHVAQGGLMMPLDLGAKGSCQLGGNISTNAGGLRVLRYGSLHGSVLGLEVVLPDGTIFDGLSTLRKDNTGYDLKQLFIGAEGTLGIVTGVSIATPQRPSAVNVAMFGLDSFEQVQQMFVKARHVLGEILSAFEFLDQDTFRIVQKHSSRPTVRDPFSSAYPFYVVLETSGSNAEHDSQKLNQLLENLTGTETIADGVLASNIKEANELWSLREGVAEACGNHGSVYKYDVSLPPADMYELTHVIRNHLASQGLLGPDKIRAVCGYGHLGDANLHINIVASEYADVYEHGIEPYIYEWVAAHNGSISAEHGLGLMKAKKIGYTKSPTQIALMQQLKRTFDPRGILNPHKTIPMDEYE